MGTTDPVECDKAINPDIRGPKEEIIRYVCRDRRREGYGGMVIRNDGGDARRSGHGVAINRMLTINESI